MKPAIIMEMACTNYVCGQLMLELWPDPAARPYLVRESASGFSAAHKKHFQAIAAENSGRIIQPVLAKHGVDPATVSEVALVGFSAGCWGVAEMLQDPDASSVTAVMCVDGLHYPTGSKFEAFARRAARGDALFVDLYSAIPVTGYTSTRDSARKLANIVGAVEAEPMLPGGDEAWSVGNFHAVGFPGSNKQAHIDQVNKYQPLAWQRFMRPWLSGDRRSGFVVPLDRDSAIPSVKPVAGDSGSDSLSPPMLMLALTLGAGVYVAADYQWDVTGRIMGWIGSSGR